MNNLELHLTFTSEEATWKFDRHTLFLGQWCLQHHRKALWSSMSYKLAEPYGLELDNRLNDQKILRMYEEALFPVLCEILNSHHATRHGERYWRILIGHWFRRTLEVLINRYKTLDACLNKYKPSTVTIFSNTGNVLAVKNTGSAIQAYSDSYWNTALFAKILEFVDKHNLSIEKIPDARNFKFGWSYVSHPLKKNKCFKKFLKQKIRTLLTLFSKSTDAVIISSYLPILDELHLQLSMWQFPQKIDGWEFKDQDVLIDYSLRQSLASNLINQNSVGLERLLQSLVFELMPACYLEGFKNLKKYCELLPWPSRPKFIFTSNSFDTNEIFKVWAGNKIESGTPYIVGQHGNNFGTSRFIDPSIQEITADKYITWGWDEGLSQHIPGFMLKKGSKSDIAYSPNGGLLLIELHPPLMMTTWDSAAEFSNYLEEQIIFVSHLPESILEELTVRLHQGMENLSRDDLARWRDYSNNKRIRLEYGHQPIEKLIARSRLVVHSYDSTGILQTLTSNIPTLAFWQGGLNHLRESALPHYQSLIDVGIVHLSAQSASMHISEAWGDIEGWWYSTKVQDARVNFCKYYANISKEPVSDLIKILNGNNMKNKPR